MVPKADHRIRPDNGSIRRSLLFFILCWSLSVPAQAQLQITGFAPGDGAVNVPTLTTIELTFSAPLDTLVRFPATGGFFLAAEQYPEFGDPLVIRIENDGAVVSADLLLAPDTQYWLIIHDAVSSTGEHLDRVYYYTFTTGYSLPTGAVSGHVTQDSNPVSGAIVQVVPADSLFGDSNSFIGGFATTDVSGNYQIEHVQAGQYVAISFLDDDRDTEPTVGEYLGVYDAGGDRVADEIDVSDGSDLSSIDVALEVFVPVTAGNLASEAADAAASVLPGETVEALGVVGGDVAADGTAEIWMYAFRGQTSGTPVTFFEVGGWLLSASAGMDGIELTVPVPSGWVDSDAAMSVAESNGGADFRASHEYVSVIAILTGTSVVFGNGPTSASVPASKRAGFAGAAAADTPAWTIAYMSDFEIRLFLIDAMTGELIGAPGTPSRASDSLAPVDEAATAWMSDAVLVSVGAAGSEGISEGGLSPYWTYAYYSPSSGTAHLFTATAGLVVNEEEINPADLPSTEPLPEPWVDSDVAAAVAEANSDGFRASHDFVIVRAYLSKNWYPGNPTLAVWVWDYSSQTSPDRKMVFVDATTGTVITATEPAALPGLELALDAPFPNPTADLAFATVHAPATSAVRLVVEDLLGRRVADLGLVDRTAGEETIRIDTGSLSAGVYFVRLLGAGTTASRQLVVVR